MIAKHYLGIWKNLRMEMRSSTLRDSCPSNTVLVEPNCHLVLHAVSGALMGRVMSSWLLELGWDYLGACGAVKYRASHPARPICLLYLTTASSRIWNRNSLISTIAEHQSDHSSTDLIFKHRESNCHTYSKHDFSALYQLIHRPTATPRKDLSSSW